MNRIVLSAGLLGATLGLSACSNNNGDSNPLLSDEEAQRQVFATTPAGDVQFANLLAALESGEVYARRVGSAALREGYTAAGTDYTLVKPDFSVRNTDAGLRQITFVIDGVEYALTEGDEVIEGTTAEYWEAVGDDNSSISIYAVNESVDSFYASESRQLQAFGYYMNPPDAIEADAGYNGFAVVGIETREGALDDRGDAVATYSGRARFEIRQQGVNWSDYNARARADVEMTADFGANTISGTGDLTNTRLRAGNTVIVEDTNPVGGLVFEEAAIQGNAFSGDLNPDAALLGSDPVLSGLVGASTYSGAFYGPTGEQVGGVASGSAVIGGENEYLMYGTFEAEEVIPD